MHPEIKESTLPINENPDGKISPMTTRKRKKLPKVVSPENPTLPLLYQVNFLYFPSRKKKAPMRRRSIAEPEREKTLEFLKES